MASDKRRRIARLEQRLADEQHSWLHSRGLASLLAWDKAHPRPDDHDPLAGYRGDGTDLTGLARLLFDARQERQR
jgi:hypothetical protein